MIGNQENVEFQIEKGLELEFQGCGSNTEVTLRNVRVKVSRKKEEDSPCCGDANPCAFPFCTQYDSSAFDLCDACSNPTACIEYEECCKPQKEYDEEEASRGLDTFRLINPTDDYKVYGHGVLWKDGSVTLQSGLMIYTYPDYQALANAWVIQSYFLIEFDY